MADLAGQTELSCEGRVLDTDVRDSRHDDLAPERIRTYQPMARSWIRLG